MPFFSRKLSSAEANYSAYDSELLAIYAVIKHFHTQLKARCFTVCTDHKPLIFAFTKTAKNVPPRRQRHLNFILQYTTDIQYVKGFKNIPVDTLSRVEAVTIPSAVPHKDPATAPKKDSKLRQLLQSTSTRLKLQLIDIPRKTVKLYCNTTNGQTGPYITPKF